MRGSREGEAQRGGELPTLVWRLGRRTTAACSAGPAAGGACNAIDRISRIGEEPQLAQIENPTEKLLWETDIGKHTFMRKADQIGKEPVSIDDLSRASAPPSTWIPCPPFPRVQTASTVVFELRPR